MGGDGLAHHSLAYDLMILCRVRDSRQVGDRRLRRQSVVLVVDSRLLGIVVLRLTCVLDECRLDDRDLTVDASMVGTGTRSAATCEVAAFHREFGDAWRQW